MNLTGYVDATETLSKYKKSKGIWDKDESEESEIPDETSTATPSNNSPNTSSTTTTPTNTSTSTTTVPKYGSSSTSGTISNSNINSSNYYNTYKKPEMSEFDKAKATNIQKQASVPVKETSYTL